MNSKFSDFRCCLHLFFEYPETAATVFYVEWRGAFYTSQIETLYGDLGSGRPSVAYYQQPNTLSDNLSN